MRSLREHKKLRLSGRCKGQPFSDDCRRGENCFLCERAADNLNADRQAFRGSTNWNHNHRKIEDVERLGITESAERTNYVFPNGNLVCTVFVRWRGSACR